MKLLNSIYAVILMLLSVRVFSIKKNFKNKRIAIVGAADSVFDEKNGDFIDSFDIVIRINKAALVWDKEKSDYLGSKFTFLFHSFFENEFSGGGYVDFEEFKKMGIAKIINPNYTREGLKTHLNFYKRHLRLRRTFILAPKIRATITKELKSNVPTVGFSALMAVLMSDCTEIYITGFTFFKTPYQVGYRRELTDPVKNQRHLEKQGVHNPDLEFKVFKKYLDLTSCKNIKIDKALSALIQP